MRHPSGHDPDHCDVKGCPWCGRTEDCPFPHEDDELTRPDLDALMRERPDGRKRRWLP